LIKLFFFFNFGDTMTRTLAMKRMRFILINSLSPTALQAC
jgi:hypothetical protein